MKLKDNFGIGTTSPTEKLYVSGNIYANGTITQGSSIGLKEDILELSLKEALKALEGLKPVKYKYKADNKDQHIGFIAESVPELVASLDRKGLSPMDIVAVLTRILQDQQQRILKLEQRIEGLEE